MYAIVEIAGKQYKVRENDKLIVPRLSGDVDDTVTFDRVLLFAGDDEDIRLGTPVVPNASVTATIVEHVKGDKVLVFRKKRRKRFKVKRGHRQPYTRIEVSGLSTDGSTPKTKKTTAPIKKADADDEADTAQKPEKTEAAGQAEATTKSGASPANAGATTKTTEAPAHSDEPETKAESDDAPTGEKVDEAPKPKKSAKTREGDSVEDEATS